MSSSPAQPTSWLPAAPVSNLSTHRSSPTRAEFHFTPKQGSWLAQHGRNRVVGSGPSVSHRRISDVETIKHEVKSVATATQSTMCNGYSGDSQRTKAELERLYPVTNQHNLYGRLLKNQLLTAGNTSCQKAGALGVEVLANVLCGHCKNSTRSCEPRVQAKLGDFSAVHSGFADPCYRSLHHAVLPKTKFSQLSTLRGRAQPLNSSAELERLGATELR